jgi:hypothetical protein
VSKRSSNDSSVEWAKVYTDWSNVNPLGSALPLRVAGRNDDAACREETHVEEVG